MSFSEIHSAIRTQFIENFADDILKFGDEQSIVLPKGTTEYARVSILTSDTQQISMAGTPTVRTTGVLVIEFYVKANQTTTVARATQLVDLVKPAVQFISLTDTGWRVLFRAVKPKNKGIEGEYYSWNATVPFVADSVG